jgi:hypothetical protein
MIEPLVADHLMTDTAEVTSSAHPSDHPGPDDGRPEERFKHLPEPIRPEDLIATVEAEPAPDPTMGRDPDRDFMLRYAGP